jgi:hypothetical protein
MNIKRSFIPSIHVSYLSCQVGSPIPAIMKSLDALERKPREKKFATGIHRISPPYIHRVMYRVLKVNRTKEIISIAIFLDLP